MRDSDIERVFGRVGDAARPDVEFEEDLLLRLDAVLRNELIVHEAADVSPASAWGDDDVHIVATADPAIPSRARTSRLLTVAASIVVVVLGVVGLLVAVRSPQPTEPAQAEPTSTLAPVSASMQQVVGAACARHADELADIDALDSPLDVQFTAAEGSMLLNRLDEITSDYVASVHLVASQMDQTIVDELDSLVRDLDNEIVFFDRDLSDAARYTVPALTDRLLAINAQLARRGVTACS